MVKDIMFQSQIIHLFLLQSTSYDITQLHDNMNYEKHKRKNRILSSLYAGTCAGITLRQDFILDTTTRTMRYMILHLKGMYFN